ncbi:MAG: alpha-isopropylmalate synthase regulatory domain-containing protein, partial [Myxococcota bacterium]|nr:alpha-isopropylmalate synthase regulatory domain-containing protein [Myxococcota bacterium]
VGFSTNRIVLGKLSGRHALADRLEQLGYHLDRARLNEVFEAFKALADKKAEILDEDLHALVTRGEAREARYQLQRVHLESGSETTPRATVSLLVDGAPREAESIGGGPVDAAIAAIRSAALAEDVTLTDYQLTGLTGGSDAQGRVNLSIRRGHLSAKGQGTHTDIVVASANAFVDALNQHAQLDEIDERAVLRRPGAAP